MKRHYRFILFLAIILVLGGCFNSVDTSNINNPDDNISDDNISDDNIVITISYDGEVKKEIKRRKVIQKLEYINATFTQQMYVNKDISNYTPHDYTPYGEVGEFKEDKQLYIGEAPFKDLSKGIKALQEDENAMKFYNNYIDDLIIEARMEDSSIIKDHPKDNEFETAKEELKLIWYPQLTKMIKEERISEEKLDNIILRGLRPFYNLEEGEIFWDYMPKVEKLKEGVRVEFNDKRFGFDFSANNDNNNEEASFSTKFTF